MGAVGSGQSCHRRLLVFKKGKLLIVLSLNLILLKAFFPPLIGAALSQQVLEHVFALPTFYQR